MLRILISKINKKSLNDFLQVVDILNLFFEKIDLDCNGGKMKVERPLRRLIH